MPALILASVTEVVPLYALRSNAKAIFPSHALKYQNRGLEVAHILSRSIKILSLAMLAANMWLGPSPTATL